MANLPGPSKGAFPRPMTVNEVNDVARELQTWVGAQLQDVVVDGVRGEEPRSLRLGFFWTGGIRWILFDYRVQAPLLLLFDGKDGVPMIAPKTAGKIRRPIELFLRSKHLGRRLREVRLRTDDRRALDLIFDPNIDGSEVSIELKIYPHGRNVRAVSGDQSVTEFKPMAAQAKVSSRSRVFDENQNTDRSRPELVAEWLEFVKPSGSEQKKLILTDTAAASNSIKSPNERLLEKKRKALEKVTQEIHNKEHTPERTIGEWLKLNQTTIVPREWPIQWQALVDTKKGLSSNIERLFTAAKGQARKLTGTRARREEIEREILALEKKIARGELRESKIDSIEIKKDLFTQAAARGRKFLLADDVVVYVGKNAAENLAILRKAQPFDYWLHLRDRPGAHAILRRTRGRIISDSEFIKAGTYVAEQSLKRRAIELAGESFDLLIVECRYVRPIKGDRLGRVNYSHDRVLRFSL